MKKSILGFVLIFSFSVFKVQAGYLQPGFDKQEYIDLLQLNAQFAANEPNFQRYAVPAGYQLKYQSQDFGMENAWALWLHESHKVMVISIRGTTANQVSWLENFYAAMVPATGSIVLSDTDTFRYKLAQHPKAAVHVGWLLGTGYLAQDMHSHLEQAWQDGYREILIVGHSQGGAISFLLTSYLRHLQKEGQIPADLVFKTYSSAAPKPGNLHYAHDYEAITQYNWAFNVVNAADWVPETPITVQTLSDVNKTNPFVQAKKNLRKQKFPSNILLTHLYSQLSRPLYRVQRRFERNLGRRAGKLVQKSLPGYQTPEYFPSNYYVRAGNAITLLPDQEYFKNHPEAAEGSHVFIHHTYKAYFDLVAKLPPTNK